MRILADTNVIIDALTSREPWNKKCRRNISYGSKSYNRNVHYCKFSNRHLLSYLERETHYSLLPHLGQNSKSSVVVYPQLLHLFVVFPLPFSKP